MSHARHHGLTHPRHFGQRVHMALTGRVLVVLLVLIVIGGTIGYVLGMIVVKGFDFLHLSELGGTKLSGK